MWDFVTAPQNLPFSVALTIMFGLALLEGAGLLLGAGLSSVLDKLVPGIDIDVDLPDVQSPGMVSQLLGWLYVGKLPFLVVLIVLLMSFGLSGLLLQHLSLTLSGGLLPALLAAPLALVPALPVTRLTTAGLARILPRDETEAVSRQSFIGRVAIITMGTARHGLAAQARLYDQYGQRHYVMVEPDNHEEVLHTGSEVLLVRRSGHGFIAIPNPSSVLSNHP
jgi:hypothetical protein